MKTQTSGVENKAEIVVLFYSIADKAQCDT